MSLFAPAFDTVLLITRTRIVRADVKRGDRPRVLNVWQRPCPDSTDLITLVDAALALAPNPSKNVWVAATSVWTGVVSLGTDVISALGDSDLSQALGFEAETFTGMSPLESSLGWKPLSGGQTERRYWLMQVSMLELNSLDQHLTSRSLRLQGLAHPAAVPLRLAVSESAADSWVRVERWDDATVCLRAVGAPADFLGTLTELTVFSGDPRGGTVQDRADVWRRMHAEFATEVFTAAPGEYPEVPEAQVIALNAANDEAMRRWAAGWLAAATASISPAPVIRVPHESITPRSRLLATAALVFLIIAGGMTFWTYQRNEVAAIRAKLNDINKITQDLRQAKTAADAQQKTNDDLQKAIASRQADLDAAADLAATQLDRYVRLLDGLAAETSESIVIEEIERRDARDLVLHGITSDAAEANRFASELSAPLHKAGWVVQPVELDVSGEGLCRFTIHIRDNATP